MIVGDDAIAAVERVGAAVERKQRLAVAGAANHQIAPHLGRIEHVQRPRAVVGHEVGDVDQCIDRPQADRGQALLQPGRRRAVLHAAYQPQRESRTQFGVFDRHLHRAGKLALDRLDSGILEFAHVGRGEIAGDAGHAGAVLPVRRQIDLEHGIAEPGPLRVSGADRGIGRQFHDAVVIVGDLQLRRRAQHAAALDAADGADAERDVLARNEGAGGREHADKPRARIRRAADDLHRCTSVAGIDHADAQAVRVGMLLGGDHARDRERRQRLGLVLEMLDLEPDHGELVGELFDRLVGVEMVLEPGEGEFHGLLLSSDVRTLLAAAAVGPLSRLRGRAGVGVPAATAAAMVSSTPVRLVMTS